MLFNSYIFILCFLPLTLFLYYGCNHFGRHTAAKVVLIVMSLWFYAYFHVSYLFILLASILGNYSISILIRKLQQKDALCGEAAADSAKARQKSGGRTLGRICLAGGIALNVGIIFYYKYFHFFLENLNRIFGYDLSYHSILMPLGISFFTFQQISYLVDCYRQEIAVCSLPDYLLFVTFFPQLIAGPIVTCEEMLPQFEAEKSRRFRQENLAKGLYFFAVGMGKKVLLADLLGRGADWGFARPASLSGAETLVVSLLYTFQLYFDFSGYCDMAYGIASMFGIELPMNFDSPYQAVSIVDFWKRWHITLNRFLRKYIYFPLGGSRKGKVRTCLNILIVFLVSGIWHGANWTFILWGLLHGLAQVIYRIFSGWFDRLPKWLGRFFTFCFVNLAWMLFRADSVTDFGVMLNHLIQWRPGGLSGELFSCFDVIEFTYLAEHIGPLGRLWNKVPGICLGTALLLAAGIAFFTKNSYRKGFQCNGRTAAKSIILLVWSVLSLSGLSVFLYFNF